MRLVVFGAGYVGLVTGTGLSDLGHDVLLFDIDPSNYELAVQRACVARIVFERILRADRFRMALDAHPSPVDAGCAGADGGRMAAEQRPERGIGGTPQLAERADSGTLQACPAQAAEPRQTAHRLAILPDATHYDLNVLPALAAAVIPFLDA